MMATIYRCPECGNQDGLYARSDVRWDPEAREWRNVDSGMEDEVDCTECDHCAPMADFEVTL
jgi:DNA-directed RNA polymerase subunit RPC12/RpoP